MAAEASENLSESDGAERKQLREQLLKKYEWYDKGTRAWSSAYNVSLFLSAGLSTTAAVVLKVLSNQRAQNISTICAAVAALLTTYIAGGGFGRKWKANRLARSSIAQLLIDIDDPKADLAQIRLRLKATMQTEDEGIIGTD